MKNWTTEKGSRIYKVAGGHSNAYLVITAGHKLLIDTSSSAAYKTLKKNLEELSFGDKESDYIILTHSHYDHCQNAAAIKDESGCSIIMSKEAERSVAEGYTPIPSGTIPITKLIVSIGRKGPAKNLRYKPFNGNTLIDKKYRPFNDDSVEIIPTPGHSTDSMSIIVDKEIALVGDTMFGIFRKSIYPPFCDDTDGMIKSWYRLLKTECSLFLPGHGSAITRKRLENQYSKHNN
ncbi:MAG TPA: MBL fold metallo-hydrolase [Bacteroidales bacterium]|nr:MBL fold metallo-hydrolase [Bacteroidales bacterium]